MLQLLIQVPLDLALAMLLLLPGFLVACVLRQHSTILERLAETLLCAMLVVPVPAFTIALLTRNYMGLSLLLGCSVVVSVLALLLLWRQQGGLWQALRRPLAPPREGDRAALLTSLAVLLLFLLNYDREHFQYACINGVVMQAISSEAAPPIDPHEEEGPIRSRERATGATMDLIDAPGTGQRYGTTTVITPWVVLFDLFGFRLIYALLGALCLLFGFRLARYFCPRPALALLAAALALCNPYVLKIVILDENVMAMTFATAALALALEGRAAVITGMALGIALGIRHVDGTLAICLALLVGPRPRPLLTMLSSALLTLVPCLLHHHFTYGSIFSHEHFIDEVFQATSHRFLGFEFEYMGLLNLPFSEAWIRTPYNPFPTSLYYPLNLLDHLGSLLCAVAVLGLASLLVRHRGLCFALAVWALPLYGLLAVLENWMDPNKMGLILCLFPLLTICLAAGMTALDVDPESPRSSRNWLWLAVLCLVLSSAAMAAYQLRVDADPRFYVKYPNVRPELPAYEEFERARVTRGGPLPSLAALQQYTPLRPLRRMMALGADYLDRRLRQPIDSAAVMEAQVQEITLDLSRPWVGRTDFVSAAPRSATVVDVTQLKSAIAVSGIRAWDPLPAELRVVRSGPAEVEVYLRFGGEPFAEVESQRLFSIEEVQRDSIQRRHASGSKLGLRLLQGDRVRLYETVSMDEVLVYTWEFEAAARDIAPGPARKMFHN